MNRSQSKITGSLIQNEGYESGGRILSDATMHVKEFLTNGEGSVNMFTIKPPGSFGERVRGRSERGGSCFFRWRLS